VVTTAEVLFSMQIKIHLTTEWSLLLFVVFKWLKKILNSTQQPGHIFIASFCPRGFVQLASDKPFNYHSGLWLLLNHIILSQTCFRLQNDSIEDSEVQIYLADFVMQVSCRFLSQDFLPISSRTEWSHINTAWLPSTVSKRWPPKSLFSRQISSG